MSGHRPRFACAAAGLVAAAALGAVSGCDQPPYPSTGAGFRDFSQVGTVRNVGDGPIRAAAGEGGVWVISGRGRTIARIDPRTRRVVRRPVRLDGRPLDVATGADAVWVVTGRNLWRIDPRTGRPDRPPTALERARRVAVGFGAVWVASSGYGGHVTRIDPRTGRITGGPFPAATNGFPQGLEVGAGGVWLSDGLGEVIRFDPQTGAVEMRVEPAEPAGDLGGLAIGGGSVWVAAGEEDGVVRIDPDSGESSLVRVQEAAYPEDVAFGQGSVWAASSNRGSLIRIDPEAFEVVGEPLTLGGLGERGIAVGAGGVWVPQVSENAVALVRRGDREEVTPVRGGRVDERAGTYRGVGLGDTPTKVKRVLGRPVPWAGNEPIIPRDADFLETSTGPEPGILDVWYGGGESLRYDDVFFYPCRAGSWCARRVGGFSVTAEGARTSQEVGIGDALDEARQKHDLDCQGPDPDDEYSWFPFCAGEIAPRRHIYFGNDPIDRIDMALVPLD